MILWGTVLDKEILNAILGFLATGLVTILVVEVHRTRQSLLALNVNLAKIIEKVANHDKALDEHGDRITFLERRKHH